MHFCSQMQWGKKCEFHFARVITEIKRVAYGLWRSLMHILFFQRNSTERTKEWFSGDFFFYSTVGELTTPRCTSQSMCIGKRAVFGYNITLRGTQSNKKMFFAERKRECRTREYAMKKSGTQRKGERRKAKR